MSRTLIFSLMIAMCSSCLWAQESDSRNKRDNGKRPTKQNAKKNRSGRDGAALFQRMDRNGDGVLTRDEVPERLQQRMTGLDRDRNGSISADEFGTAMQRRLGGQNGRGGKQSNMRNGGKDSGMRQRMTEQMQDPEMWLKRLDRNGDQVISKDEIPARLEKRFAKIDKNGNDQLDKNEIVAIVEVMKAEGGMKKSRYRTDSSKTKPQMPKRPPRN